MSGEGRKRQQRQTLATDLDGTLIPLADNPRNEADLWTLSKGIQDAGLRLVYVTGRHQESVQRAMKAFQLPKPELIICDVGASVVQCPNPGVFKPDLSYRKHLEQIVRGLPPSELQQKLPAMEGLRLQEAESQGPFKLSFYATTDRLEILVARLQSQLERLRAPYSIIHSVDPFTGNGLIDLLPEGVSKAGALSWWVEKKDIPAESIVFAGDSGNDRAALVAGYRSVIVANAGSALARHVYDAHRQMGWENRLYLAQRTATSGLLEGCRWFELIEAEDESTSVRRSGATPLSVNRSAFRVWAPSATRVAVRLESDARGERENLPLEEENSRVYELTRGQDGVFEGTVKGAGPGTLYKYVLDEKQSRPDPASRWQPAGVDGASRVVASQDFAWSDAEWRGVAKHRLLLYELHPGTFTTAGTLRAAIERLPALVELGITAVELMPVAQTAGRWNWGYDGVDLFAVRDSYGGPHELKAFVDACHARGLAVILDVVYNHLGPEGCVLQDFGPYFSQEHETPWGTAFNFDGDGSEHVREFLLENALEWLRDYHLDGLRLDSVHHIFDRSESSILAELRQRVGEFAATLSRPIHLIFETNVYDEALLQPTKGRPGCDAIWCDDLMHSLLTLARPGLQLTDREYEGAEDLVRVLRRGRVYAWRDAAPVRVEEPRPLAQSEEEDSPLASLVTSLQNHDGIGNHPQGKRIHQLSSKEFQKAAATLTLLAPGIPLLFMGEEWAVDTRFPFFCDFQDPALRKLVEESRARETAGRAREPVLSPFSEESFERARWHESLEGDPEIFDWYRRLIILRKEGLREGWLVPEGLVVEHEPAAGIFSLHFTRQYGAAIQARVRLTAADRDGGDPVTVPFTGHVLLSSRGKWEQKEDRLLLHANHAVVSLETGHSGG